jgi:hypothetical protein
VRERDLLSLRGTINMTQEERVGSSQTAQRRWKCVFGHRRTDSHCFSVHYIKQL